MDFSKFIYCCLESKKNTDITLITQDKNENQIKETNEDQNKKNILMTHSSKISIIYIKSLIAQ